MFARSRELVGWLALHGNFREGINHAGRELLVYDPGGQTTPAVEYANAHAGTQRGRKD